MLKCDVQLQHQLSETEPVIDLDTFSSAVLGNGSESEL